MVDRECETDIRKLRALERTESDHLPVDSEMKMKSTCGNLEAREESEEANTNTRSIRIMKRGSGTIDFADTMKKKLMNSDNRAEIEADWDYLKNTMIV